MCVIIGFWSNFKEQHKNEMKRAIERIPKYWNSNPHINAALNRSWTGQFNDAINSHNLLSNESHEFQFKV